MPMRAPRLGCRVWVFTGLGVSGFRVAGFRVLGPSLTPRFRGLWGLWGLGGSGCRV